MATGSSVLLKMLQKAFTLCLHIIGCHSDVALRLDSLGLKCLKAGLRLFLSVSRLASASNNVSHLDLGLALHALLSSLPAFAWVCSQDCHIKRPHAMSTVDCRV